MGCPWVRTARVKRDAAFREELLKEGVQCLLSGDVDTGKAVLRDYINARTRDKRGKRLSYIEGWHIIAEANRIFGFDGWDRQTVATQCVWKGVKQGREGCAYVARVRIRVREEGCSRRCQREYGSRRRRDVLGRPVIGRRHLERP